ncbi:MAG: bifunctional diaminohydroxyphosphoribosylaminopyrimidine deaminase/5-amino-6-(5-phosphoribosylamino)uracil reductase RibD [Solirubrobacterales bacterium]
MNSQLTSADRQYLRRALELAERGRGRVSPNPLVGAVVVRDGVAIGEGWHAEVGGLHAERAALADCEGRGGDPAGATMYVTLEPCAHQGRQPPCVDALLEAGISRVVIAADDPSEKTAGRGPAILREAGVAVDFADDPEAGAARLLNQPFRKHARTGRPFATLKLAISLDGQIATTPGDSPWISGAESRALVHRWRAESDAIAVGIGTVLADDPLLTARPDSGDTAQTPRQPLRIVFDSQARLPVTSQLLQTLDQSPVLVITAPDPDPARADALRQAGAELLTASGDTHAERINSALTQLGGREVTSLFLEGGRSLATAFAAADAIDESRTFVAPTLLATVASRAGGAGAGGAEDALARSAPPAPASGPARLQALSTSSEPVGDDLLITARFKEW